MDGVVVLGRAVAANLFEVAEHSLAPGGARGHFLFGATSIVRALGWGGQRYDRLLNFFHCKAVDPDALCRCGMTTVFARMPGIHRVKGRPELPGDGLAADQTTPKTVPDNQRD